MPEKVNRKDNRVLQVKISEELKLQFDTLCNVLSVNKSNLIRGLVQDWMEAQLKNADTAAKYNSMLKANNDVIAAVPAMRSVISK